MTQRLDEYGRHFTNASKLDFKPQVIAHSKQASWAKSTTDFRINTQRIPFRLFTNLVKFIDNILDPLRCHLDIMINAGLMINAATETSASYSS